MLGLSLLKPPWDGCFLRVSLLCPLQVAHSSSSLPRPRASIRRWIITTSVRGKKFRSSDGRVCHPLILQTFSRDGRNGPSGAAGLTPHNPTAPHHLPQDALSSPVLKPALLAPSAFWQNGLFSLHRSLNLYRFQAMGSPHCAGFVINY